MIIFNATSRRAACLSDDAITTGSVGMEVRFSCSDEWDGLSRVAVFRGSGEQVDVALTGDSCNVPPEVLAKTGGDLHIGLYGTDGSGHLVIPTVYANAGRIQRGTAPSGIEPTPQTQPLIDQLLAAAQAARDEADAAAALAQSVRDDADAGAFDGEDGYSPSASVSKSGKVVTISITDKAGTTTESVTDGEDGDDGKSAYAIAVENGFIGTEAQWLQSLHGEDATVDATLSNAGEAADAAETGKVKKRADYALRFAETMNNGVGIPLDAKWLPGDIGGSRAYRAHSKRATNTERKVLQAAAGYRFYLRIYDNGSYSDSSWYGPAYASRLTYTLPEGADYILVVSTSPEDQSVTADPEAYGAQVTIRNNIGSGGGAVSSVNGQAGAVTLSIPTKTSDLSNDSGFLTQHQDITGKLDVAQGSGNAGKFLVVGSDGNVTAVTMSAWQGGSY